LVLHFFHMRVIRHSVSGMINLANFSDLNQFLTHTQLEKMTINQGEGLVKCTGIGVVVHEIWYTIHR